MTAIMLIIGWFAVTTLGIVWAVFIANRAVSTLLSLARSIVDRIVSRSLARLGRSRSALRKGGKYDRVGERDGFNGRKVADLKKIRPPSSPSGVVRPSLVAWRNTQRYLRCGATNTDFGSD